MSKSTFYRELRRSPGFRAVRGTDVPSDRRPTDGSASRSVATRRARAKDKVQTSSAAAGSVAEPTEPLAARSASRRPRTPRPGRAAKAPARGAAAETADEARGPVQIPLLPVPAPPVPAVDTPVTPRRRGPRRAARQARPLTPGVVAAPPDAVAAATVRTEADSEQLGELPGTTIPAQPRLLSRLLRGPYTVAEPMRDRMGHAEASRGNVGAPRAVATAPSSGDWMPPAMVLGLQLVVAMATGAHLLVVIAILLSTAGIIAAVRVASRHAAPAPAPAVLTSGASPLVGSAEPTAARDRDAVDPTTGQRRAMDLRWVASTILPAGAPPEEPRPPRSRS